MKKIITKGNQIFIVLYTSIYVLFFMALISYEIRDLFIKPDYVSQRYDYFYSNPADVIIGLTILFIISAYPLIVIINMLIISKKLINIEKKLIIKCKS